MDIGIIATRYAKALLDFAIEKREACMVFSEMRTLHHNFLQFKSLTHSLSNPVLNEQQKMTLLASACIEEKETMSSTTTRFIKLVIEKKRENLFPFICSSYMRQYEANQNRVHARITLATKQAQSTVKRIEQLVKQRTNKEVQTEICVDTSLRAGFILEYEDYRLDASLRKRMERLRRKLK